MGLQAVNDALFELLKTTDLDVYHARAAGHLTAEKLPFVVYSLDRTTPMNFMGGAPRDLLGVVLVYHFAVSDKGTAALRALEEATYTALHQQSLTATGFEGCQLRCIQRGDVDQVEENLVACTDLYELTGSESA